MQQECAALAGDSGGISRRRPLGSESASIRQLKSGRFYWQLYLLTQMELAVSKIPVLFTHASAKLTLPHPVPVQLMSWSQAWISLRETLSSYLVASGCCSTRVGCVWSSFSRNIPVITGFLLVTEMQGCGFAQGWGERWGWTKLGVKTEAINQSINHT